MLAAGLPAARAAPIAGESGGTVSRIDLLSLGGLLADSSTIGVLTGSSPAPYHLSSTCIDITASHSNLLTDLYLQAGAGSLRASSNVDGNTPSPRSVSGQALIDGLVLSAFDAPFFDPLVSASMGDETLGASVSVQGSSALDMVIDAESELPGLQLEILGASIYLTAFLDGSGHAAPNTQILSAAHGIPGRAITLNEQIELGNNVNTFGLQLSAIHLNFDEVGRECFELDSIPQWRRLPCSSLCHGNHTGARRPERRDAGCHAPRLSPEAQVSRASRALVIPFGNPVHASSR